MMFVLMFGYSVLKFKLNFIIVYVDFSLTLNILERFLQFLGVSH